jgi:hypothetical protein
VVARDSLSPLRTLVPPYCKRIHSGAGQHEAVVFPLCVPSRANPSGLGHAATIYSSVQGPPGVETLTGLDLKYYPRCLTGSTRGVIVSPIGEGNPRLRSMVNLVTVLNTELDHTLDELGTARAVVELCAERAERRHQEDGSPAPVGIQHPYRSLPRDHHAYGTPDCRTWINMEP